MYRRIINFLRGSVRLQVESPCPERVVNLCAAHEIPFWALKWQDASAFTVMTTRRGLCRLQEVIGETTCTVTPLAEYGAPTLLLRFRRRYVLLGAVAVFLLLFLAGNLFIWEFRVTGNRTVPTETILRALEDYGLHVGSFGMEVDQEDLRNHVLLELPDVSWLAVNVKGCVAHVQVVERQRPPRRVEEHEVSNVVARCAGWVTKIQALDGVAQVAVGSTVTEGQLLISGVMDTGRSGVRLLHGMGQVEARTWHEVSVLVPLQGQRREKADTAVRFAVDFGKQRIKLYGKGSMTGANCDKIIHYTPWTLPGGFRLPITWVTERLVSYETSPDEKTVEAARQEGEAAALALLEQQLPPGSTVSDTRFAAAQRGGCLLVTLKAECLEEIGTQVVLPAAQP